MLFRSKAEAKEAKARAKAEAKAKAKASPRTPAVKAKPCTHTLQTCTCGAPLSKNKMAKHLRSKVHQDALSRKEARPAAPKAKKETPEQWRERVANETPEQKRERLAKIEASIDRSIPFYANYCTYPDRTIDVFHEMNLKCKPKGCVEKIGRAHV